MKKWFTGRQTHLEPFKQNCLSPVVSSDPSVINLQLYRKLREGEFSDDTAFQVREPREIPGLAQNSSNPRLLSSTVPSSSRWASQRCQIIEQWIAERLSSSKTSRVQLAVQFFLNDNDSGAKDSKETSATSPSKPAITLGSLAVSRRHLLSAGLTQSHIDRIYRALYTYSVGINELFADIAEKGRLGKHHDLATNLWRVYISLIETVNSTGHLTAFSRLESRYRDDLLAVVSKSSSQFRHAVSALEQAQKDVIGLREQYDQEHNMVLELIQRIDQLQLDSLAGRNRAENDRLRFETAASQLEGTRARLAAVQCRTFLDRSQIRRLTAQLRMSTTEIADLMRQLLAVIAERNEFKRRFGFAEEQLRVLTERHNMQGQQYNDILIRYGHVSDEFHALSKSHDISEAELDRERTSNRDFRQRLNQVQVALEESARRFDDVNNRLMNVSSQLTERLRQHDHDMTLIASLKADIGSISLQNLVVTAQTTDLTSELERWQRQAGEQQLALTEASGNSVQLVEQLRGCQASNADLEQNLSEVKETLATVQQELETSQNEGRRQRTRVLELKTSLARASEQVNEAVATLHTTRRIKDAKIADLEQELAIMQKADDEHRLEAISSEKTVSQLRSELRSLKASLDAAQAELLLHSASLIETKKDRGFLEHLVESQKNSIASLERRLQAANSEMKTRDLVQLQTQQYIADLKNEIEKLNSSIIAERGFQHDISQKRPLRLKRRHSTGNIHTSVKSMHRTNSLQKISITVKGKDEANKGVAWQSDSLMNIMVRACQEMQNRLEKQQDRIRHLEASIAEHDQNVEAPEPRSTSTSSTNFSILSSIENIERSQKNRARATSLSFSQSTEAVVHAEESPPSSVDDEMEELDKLLLSRNESMMLRDDETRFRSGADSKVLNSVDPSQNRIAISRERATMTGLETLSGWSPTSASSFDSFDQYSVPKRKPRQSSSELKVVMPTEAMSMHNGNQALSALEDALRAVTTERARRDTSGPIGVNHSRRRQTEWSVRPDQIPSNATASTWSIMRESERLAERDRRRQSLEKLTLYRQNSLK